MKRYILSFLIGVVTTTSALAQHRIAEGRVIDLATGQGLLGVTVSDGQRQVITDQSGHYRMQLQGSSAEFRYSYDGYLTRTLVVPLRSDSTHVYDIYMSSEAFAPLEAQHGAYTNNASLSADDAISVHLASKVRSIARGGQFGEGSMMLIRGLNSLNTNVQPLIVIDGVVIEQLPGEQSIHGGFAINRLLDIDVQDIDHIDVINDATSLYGSKGANGVILISTKRGITNQTKITLNASMTSKMRPHLPEMMNSNEFRSYVSEVYKGSTQASNMAGGFEGIFVEQVGDKTYNKNHNNTDWADEVYQTGLLQRYALGIQGGDDVARYNVSVGYLTADEAVKQSSFTRINTRVNADINLAKWFDLGAEVYFSRIERELRDDGADAVTSPAFAARVKSPFFHPYNYTDDGLQLTKTISDVDALGVTNPTALIENAKGAHKQYRFSINVTPTFHFGNDWTVRGQFSYYQDNVNEHYFSPMVGVTPVEIPNVGISYNTVREQNISQNSIYGDVNVGWQHLFAGEHLLKASLGQRLNVNTYKSTFGEGHNTGDDQIYNLSTSLDFLQSDGSDLGWRSTSLYLQAQYTFRNIYHLWAVVTSDASSRFGAKAADSFGMLGARWTLFPSVGLSWDAKGESFLSDVSWLDALNLHASVGESGNDAINAIASWGYLAPINYLGVATGNVISNLRNDHLKWETTRKATAGINVALLHDRLQLAFDVFSHRTEDLLTMRQSDIITGMPPYLTNSGSLKNRGLEAQINGKLIDSRKFKWAMGLSLAHYKNSITSLPEGEFETEVLNGHVLSAVGHPAGVFYGYRTAGVFATSADASAANLKVRNEDASLSTFAAGDIHFVEPNATYADGIIDQNDRTVIGDPNPDLTGAFSTLLQYGRWSLDVQCTFSLGGDIYNYQRSLLESMDSFHNQSRHVLGRWKYEGQQTDVPRSSYADPMGNGRFSDRWIEDGSYLKIRNVRLSYALPINNPYIEGVTFWGSVDNLCTFTKYLGSDPETYWGGSVFTQGVDYGLMPSCRTFNFGIKLNL